MFSIQVTADADILSKWTELPQRFRAALAEKMDVIARALEEKVRENLSGRILNVKSGQLLGSIKREVYTQGNEFVAFVGPIPATPKAFTQEYGGKGSFDIFPTKARVLHFFTKDGASIFTKHVNHPPLPERSYLRSALLELAPEIGEHLIADIDKIVR